MHRKSTLVEVVKEDQLEDNNDEFWKVHDKKDDKKDDYKIGLKSRSTLVKRPQAIDVEQIDSEMHENDEHPDKEEHDSCGFSKMIDLDTSQAYTSQLCVIKPFADNDFA